jgi:hypothetical protein
MTDDEIQGRAGPFVTFAEGVRIAAGTLAEAAVAARRALARDEGSGVLVFDVSTGKVVDLDLRGTEAEVAARHGLPPPSKRGRPKLGVVAREVTLLPRHWDWLADQPGGASVALRRLVEAARKDEGEAGAVRARREAAYRFMSAMAGDRPGFEEATRALFAGDEARLRQSAQAWPPDVLDQVLRCLRIGGEEA